MAPQTNPDHHHHPVVFVQHSLNDKSLSTAARAHASRQGYLKSSSRPKQTAFLSFDASHLQRRTCPACKRSKTGLRCSRHKTGPDDRGAATGSAAARRQTITRAQAADPRNSLVLGSRSQSTYLPTGTGTGTGTNALALDLDGPDQSRGVSRMSLIQHFQRAPREVLGTPDSATVLKLGFAHPYLFEAVLAVSASHLRYHTSESDKYRVAELKWQTLALSGFQTALYQPITRENADSLLLTSLIINLLSFSTPEDVDPTTSWVFTNDSNSLSWFSIISGYGIVRSATQPFHKDSMLSWMFAASNKGPFHEAGGPLDRVPDAWLELCGLDRASLDTKSIFYEPVRVLAALTHLPATPLSFFGYIAFFMTLTKKFKALLEAKDDRAMWLMGYWFGLLCRFSSIWWVHTIAWRDYRAVQLWLARKRDQRTTAEEKRMWVALEGDLNAACHQPGHVGGR